MLLTFQHCILGSVDSLWLLSKGLLANHMQGIDNHEANEGVQCNSDMHRHSGKIYRTLAMFADSQFQRRVYSHLSCSNTNIQKLLALSGYPILPIPLNFTRIIIYKKNVCRYAWKKDWPNTINGVIETIKIKNYKSNIAIHNNLLIMFIIIFSSKN